MDLKTICMNNLVNLIKNLPPLLKEEVIGQSIKTIREEERLKIMKEIKRSASVVVDDVTEKIINSYNEFIINVTEYINTRTKLSIIIF